MMKLKIEEFIKKLGRKEMDLPEEFKLKMPCRSDEPTGITHLPENVTFGGYFDPKACTGITHLPENLTVVEEYLDITKIDK